MLVQRSSQKMPFLHQPSTKPSATLMQSRNKLPAFRPNVVKPFVSTLPIDLDQPKPPVVTLPIYLDMPRPIPVPMQRRR